MSLAGILVAILAGVAIGQGLYTFHYGQGLSYFSTNPKACANCHIMQAHYDGWQKASHHTSATCIDCHLPHELVPKYLAKAENGFWHSKGFTLEDFHEPIMLRERSERILQHSCLHCHADFVHDVLAARPEQEELNCIHCHRSVGHGETVGLGRFEPLTPDQRKTWGPHE
jgi:cytochrome c nitrite reductase small subunit